MLYVNDCFANSSLFHKALKEAFEFFCNKNVAGSSTAELMANFCDNLLRKVCCAAKTLWNLCSRCCYVASALLEVSLTKYSSAFSVLVPLPCPQPVLLLLSVAGQAQYCNATYIEKHDPPQDHLACGLSVCLTSRRSAVQLRVFQNLVYELTAGQVGTGSAWKLHIC